jgi:hypothetical protein
MAGFSDLISDNFFEELKLQGEADHAPSPLHQEQNAVAMNKAR